MSSGGSSETVYTMDGSHIKLVISEELRSLVLDEHPTVGIHISSRYAAWLFSWTRWYLKVYCIISKPHLFYKINSWLKLNETECGEICAIVFRQFLQLLSTHSGPNEAQGALQDVLSSLKAGYVNHTIHAIPAVRQPATNRYSVSYNDFSNSNA